MSNRTKPIVLARLVAALTIPGLALQAATTVPLHLPRPDGKPGNPKKPVKVYLLAGQSNMNGMGDLIGARPPWPSVLLSADPAIIPGNMPIGGSALAAHGVYQSSDPKAGKGARVSLYPGAFDAKADYAKLTPAKTATVALGTVAEEFPTNKDQGATKEEYEKHLVNLINDLRKEFKAPRMRAVVATAGFGGYRMADIFKPIWAAQMAVGDPKQHPEFAGTVASVDTRDFWREVEESPPVAGLSLPPQCRNLPARGRGDGAGDGALGGRRGRGDPEVGSRRRRVGRPERRLSEWRKTPSSIRNGMAPADAVPPKRCARRMWCSCAKASICRL